MKFLKSFYGAGGGNRISRKKGKVAIFNTNHIFY